MKRLAVPLRFTVRRIKTLRSLDTGATLVLTALRLPPPVILRRVAACLSVPKVWIGSNAANCTVAIGNQAVRHFIAVQRPQSDSPRLLEEGDALASYLLGREVEVEHFD